MRTFMLIAAMLVASPAFAYETGPMYPTIGTAYPGPSSSPSSIYTSPPPIYTSPAPYNPYVQPDGHQNTIDRFRPGVTGIWPGDRRW
jgi:hypothetical protein